MHRGAVSPQPLVLLCLRLVSVPVKPGFHRCDSTTALSVAGLGRHSFSQCVRGSPSTQIRLCLAVTKLLLFALLPKTGEVKLQEESSHQTESGQKMK